MKKNLRGYIDAQGSPKAALAQKREPALAPAVTCPRTHVVADLQRLLIESETHFVVVLDQSGRQSPSG